MRKRNWRPVKVKQTLLSTNCNIKANRALYYTTESEHVVKISIFSLRWKLTGPDLMFSRNCDWLWSRALKATVYLFMSSKLVCNKMCVLCVFVMCYTCGVIQLATFCDLFFRLVYKLLIDKEQLVPRNKIQSLLVLIIWIEIIKAVRADEWRQSGTAQKNKNQENQINNQAGNKEKEKRKNEQRRHAYTIQACASQVHQCTAFRLIQLFG